jgi:hypothetical protein
MLSILLTSFFSLQTFSTAIKIVSKILPKKYDVKTARQTQNCWLVALLLCNNWVLCCCSQESISCIARSNNIKHRFFVLLQGREQLSSHCNMQTVDCKKQTTYFLCHIAMSKQQRLQFLCHIAREQSMIQHHRKQGVARV